MYTSLHSSELDQFFDAAETQPSVNTLTAIRTRLIEILSSTLDRFPSSSISVVDDDPFRKPLYRKLLCNSTPQQHSMFIVEL